MHRRAGTNPLGTHSKFAARDLVYAASAAMLATVSFATAAGPPKLNVVPSCESAGAGSVVAGRNTQACLDDERAAQNELTKNWATYAAADKTLCVGMNRTGGPSSYVELVSCLNIIRDAKIIRGTQLLAEPLVNNGKLSIRSKRAARGQRQNDLD
jgi:hypothetical protein